MDNVLLLKFNDSVEWDRILLRPTDSSLTLKRQTARHTDRLVSQVTLSIRKLQVCVARHRLTS